MEAERQAVSDVTSAWELMTSNKAQIKSIKDQVKANEIALDGVQKEEALGNRTIFGCFGRVSGTAEFKRQRS